MNCRKPKGTRYSLVDWPDCDRDRSARRPPQCTLTSSRKARLPHYQALRPPVYFTPLVAIPISIIIHFSRHDEAQMSQEKKTGSRKQKRDSTEQTPRLSNHNAHTKIDSHAQERQWQNDRNSRLLGQNAAPWCDDRDQSAAPKEFRPIYILVEIER